MEKQDPTRGLYATDPVVTAVIEQFSKEQESLSELGRLVNKEMVDALVYELVFGVKKDDSTNR